MYISHVSSVRAIAVVEKFFFHPALVFASNRLPRARLVTYCHPLPSSRVGSEQISFQRILFRLVRVSPVSAGMSEVKSERNSLDTTMVVIRKS